LAIASSCQGVRGKAGERSFRFDAAFKARNRRRKAMGARSSTAISDVRAAIRIQSNHTLFSVNISFVEQPPRTRGSRRGRDAPLPESLEHADGGPGKTEVHVLRRARSLESNSRTRPPLENDSVSEHRDDAREKPVEDEKLSTARELRPALGGRPQSLLECLLEALR
jgi:hypothetical protein